MSQTAETVHRVVPLADDLRNALRATREQRGTTNARVVADAVANHLPALVERLRALGFGRPATRVRPVRLPFSSQTLKDLRAASQQVAVPACALFAICLAVATADDSNPGKGRKGRGKRAGRRPAA